MAEPVIDEIIARLSAMSDEASEAAWRERSYRVENAWHSGMAEAFDRAIKLVEEYRDRHRPEIAVPPSPHSHEAFRGLSHAFENAEAMRERGGNQD